MIPLSKFMDCEPWELELKCCRICTKVFDCEGACGQLDDDECTKTCAECIEGWVRA